ncbi:hypothetical protein [Actinoplanes derwentensis]|uniref:Uncharacterized protein n=1 Tax=Actinoplanes derwentensis TaxID=113562 RepID=A0A1H2CV18_9ACTN|nr:hypothetical protein [Actinoplanes derwentensis]GID81910.1 hypothetical protein Ade03nite_08340 [Actinoplanes derwentensis]SDT74042.1 hypothetical protein SAMN04489716_6858 [Actinoplanes derwentensis]
MFETIRRRNRKARMRNELGQSVDHFKRAATIAAAETSSTVAPRINAARDRVQPAATAARATASQSWDSALAALTTASESVRQAGKTTKKVTRKQLKVQEKQARKLQRKAEKVTGRKKSRAGRLAGYALLGTAVGIGAAYVARRRREAQWEEYEPTTRTGTDDASFDPIEPTVYTTANGTATDQNKPDPR